MFRTTIVNKMQNSFLNEGIILNTSTTNEVSFTKHLIISRHCSYIKVEPSLKMSAAAATAAP